MIETYRLSFSTGMGRTSQEWLVFFVCIDKMERAMEKNEIILFESEEAGKLKETSNTTI